MRQNLNAQEVVFLVTSRKNQRKDKILGLFYQHAQLLGRLTGALALVWVLIGDN